MSSIEILDGGMGTELISQDIKLPNYIWSAHANIKNPSSVFQIHKKYIESGSDYMSHTNDNILVIAQLEDIQVLDNLDNILSVEGIDLFTSGAQDIAQSMGLPGQPNHQRVKEFEAKVRDAVHAAGRKMAEDVMASARAANLFLDGARAFLNSR